MKKTIKPIKKINNTITVPGDKSISHRAVMFGAIAEGDTKITGFLTGDDCRSTIKCFKQMGVHIEEKGTDVIVHGKGLHSLTKPDEILDVGNSGTTLRLITGILAWQNFTTELTGDHSIQKRPMDRVITPLKEMGANIEGKDGGTLAPLTITGTKLNGTTYTMPMASAQVKSAILLASLDNAETTVIEPIKTRDHTEIMLNYLGANIIRDGDKIISKPFEKLVGRDISVPADISSAAYFIIAALIIPDSVITIKNVSVNPTRTGIITALQEMGGDITLSNEQLKNGEPTADITVKYSKLKGIKISGDIIPKMIDEIPVFAVAALFAEGTTIVADAHELKVKESNRIKAMVEELTKLGATISDTEDGMIIKQSPNLKSATVESYLDHRIAMSLAIVGLTINGGISINDSECVEISFPGFYDLLENL